MFNNEYIKNIPTILLIGLLISFMSVYGYFFSKAHEEIDVVINIKEIQSNTKDDINFSSLEVMELYHGSGLLGEYVNFNVHYQGKDISIKYELPVLKSYSDVCSFESGNLEKDTFRYSIKKSIADSGKVNKSELNECLFDVFSQLVPELIKYEQLEAAKVKQGMQAEINRKSFELN